jgi:hypothetical protein
MLKYPRSSMDFLSAWEWEKKMKWHFGQSEVALKKDSESRPLSDAEMNSGPRVVTMKVQGAW